MLVFGLNYLFVYFLFSGTQLLCLQWEISFQQRKRSEMHSKSRNILPKQLNWIQTEQHVSLCSFVCLLGCVCLLDCVFRFLWHNLKIFIDHVLGRWCFAVSNIGWMERSLASALFASPPSSSFQEALVT